MTIDIESAAAAVVHARATYGMTAETGEAIRRLAVALCDDDPRPMEPAAVDLSRLERIVADCAQPAAVGALEAVRWEGWSENSQEWIPIPRRMFDGFAKKPDEYIKVRALVPADAAQAQIAALTAKVAELEAERDQLRAKAITSDMLLTEMAARDGGFHIGLEGGACKLMAEAFADQFKESGAENYLEVSFSFASKHAMPGEGFTVTIQRHAGKTPHMLRAEAEAKVAGLERDRERLRATGTRMSNTLFNLKQSDEIASRWREAFDDLQRAWDDAIEAARHDSGGAR